VTSQIDPTIPIFGAPTTASVRNNFLIARNEITALQTILGGTSSGRASPINVGGSGTLALPLEADVIVYVNNLTGAGITITLPSGNVADQRVIIKDVAGNAATYNITVNTTVGSGIDGLPTYTLVSNFMSVDFDWTGSKWVTI
jgi:hypothetical protein